MTGQLSDDQLLEAIGRLDRLLRGVNLMGLNAAVKRRAMEAFSVVLIAP